MWHPCLRVFLIDPTRAGLYDSAVTTSSKGRKAVTPVGELSESLEDYLEIILQLQQEKRVARVRDIASRKGVSNASVSNALSRLARDGFVLHEAREFVELTDRGMELARRVLHRHAFLISFLRDVLQVSEDTAEADACAIEHHVSAETLEKLATFYQFVRSCPQNGSRLMQAFRACCSTAGEPAACSEGAGHCPWAQSEGGCTVDDQRLVTLDRLQPGDVGTVVRLSAPSPVREQLVDSGLLPNVRLEMLRATDGGRELQVSVQGCAIKIETAAAASVVVRRS